MQRRTFLQLAGTSLALGMFAGAAPRFASAMPARSSGEFDAVRYRSMRRYARTAFGNIAYTEYGSGSAALFLHGFPLNGFQWRGALPRLSPYRRCIAPDWLGLGYTEVAPGDSVTPDTQVKMLVALMQQLGIDKADLIANDSGGAVAQLFMTRHPERVRSLLLTNCDVENDSPPAAVVPAIAAARKGRFALDTFPPQLADKRFARSATGIGGLCYQFPDHPTDEAIDYYFTPLVATPERVALTDAYAMGLDPNPLAGIEAALRRCQVPVRIVWGTGDTIFSARSPDYLDRVLPLSHGVRKVKGAKLFFPEEHPELIAEEAKKLWGVS